jgi:hypothetical protein
MNQLADDHSDNMAFSRFFHNESVQPEVLETVLQNRAKEVNVGNHLLCLQDTTEINKERHRNLYDADDPDLGPTGNNKNIGFFMHPVLLVDAAGYFPRGFSSVTCWNRAWDKQDKHDRNYEGQPISEKESNRWITSGLTTKKLLEKQCAHLTIIGDRESDIYEEFVQLKSDKCDVLVRSRDNRILQGTEERLYEYLAHQPSAGSYKLKVRDDSRKGQVNREALIEIRFCRVKIARPKNHKDKDLPAFIELTAIEARERLETGVTTKPVLWRLLTTHQVGDVSMALQMVEWYKTRWLIEEIFRLLKNQGIDIEASQLESGKALKSLAILGLQAVLRILQLRQDRDGLCSMHASVTFSPDEIEFAELVGKHHIKSTTKLQSNPFPVSTLAWMGWIMARLGGWKGYRSSSQPGVITLKRGLDRFDQMYNGFLLQRHFKDVYKE